MNLNSYIASHRKIVLLLSLISIFLSPLVFSDFGFSNYRILKNDTLFSISNKLNVDLKDIYSLNPDIGLSPDIIRPGINLIIPLEDSINLPPECSKTGTTADAKNIKMSHSAQLTTCIDELESEININILDEPIDEDWDLIESDIRYQIFINNKLVYLLNYEPENIDLQKYLLLLHESARRNNEISIICLYLSELNLDSYEGLELNSWDNLYEKYFELELSDLGKLRRDIFMNWQNMKYYDFDQYHFSLDPLSYKESFQEGWINAGPDFSDLDKFCRNDVYNKPSTFDYGALIGSNIVCANFYDDYGINDWKRHMDRSFELLKRSKSPQIYGSEYDLILFASYFSNLLNDYDYFHSYLEAFSDKKCPECQSEFDILNDIEDYVQYEASTLNQVDTVRYIRMNVVERLGRKNFYGVDYITDNAGLIIDLVKADIKRLKNQDRYEAASTFEVTLFDVFRNTTEALTNIGECNTAEEYTYKRKRYNKNNIYNFYDESHDLNFVEIMSLAYCFQSYFDSEYFFVNEDNFSIKKAHQYVEEASNELTSFEKFTEGYDEWDQELSIFRNYLISVKAYNYYLDGDIERSRETLKNYQSLSKNKNQNKTPLIYSRIVDNTIQRYAELYFSLSLSNDIFPDPITEKLYKDNLFNSLRSGNKKINNYSYTSSTLKNIQTNLQTNEYAVVFFSSASQTKILLISKDEYKLFDSVGSFEIDYFTDQLRDTLNNPQTKDFDFDSALYLYDILISPYEAHIKKNSLVKIIGSDHMIVPFSVFVKDYNPNEINKTKQLISADWIIKHYNFVRIFNDEKNDDKVYQERFLGISNSSSYTWSGLPDLSDSKSEVTKLGIVSNAKRDLILNNNNTKEDFLERLNKSYERIVIATHAVPPFWNGATFEASLLFNSNEGNFFLTPSEIINHNFSSDMVVLSSCNTASNSFTNLFNAFISSGANSVVHTNWNLESTFASKFTTSFFEDLWLNPKPKHKALRDISLKFMSDYSNLKNIHPSYWGNFSIIYSDF